MEYNILWIDDEHESLTGTKGRAKRNGINLIPFRSLDGIDELERNYSYYDGVLLDAKFWESETDIAGSEDTEFVHRAKERILQLPKKFEIFVLTAQAEAYDDRQFTKAFTKVYKKADNNDIERLFVDIKAAADKQEDTQLRFKFKRVFDVCTERYIGENAAHDILTLLKIDDSGDFDDRLNLIRKLIEDLFSAFHKYKLLPGVFVSPHISLNESSKFLAGKKNNDEYFEEKGFIHLEGTHLPEVVAYLIQGLLHHTQSGSHRSVIDRHLRLVQNTFLMKGLVYQLMDVLTWFKIYVDGNPKQENWKNKNQIQALESDKKIGTVFNFNYQKGFAFFKPVNGENSCIIPPNIVSQYELNENDRIEAELEEYFDPRKNHNMTRVIVARKV
jgi:cold shock CspA family protein